MTYDSLKIGDLISLKSHAYNDTLHGVIITGDHNALPPIMIIKEIRRVTAAVAGSLASHYIFKCIWFSSRSNTMQEASFKDFHLKPIVGSKEENEEAEPNVEINEGDMVLLKSTRLELTKRKSTFSVEEGSSSTAASKTTQSALLTHLPPVFHVISVKANKPLQQSKNASSKNYWNFTRKIKCFYYNSQSEKISEVELPIEALERLVPLADEILVEINTFISNKSYISFTAKGTHPQIIQPTSLSFRSGLYFLKAYNVIEGQNKELLISADSSFIKIDDPVMFKSPTVEMSYFTKEQIIADFVSKIKTAQEHNLYLRIKYINKNDEVTVRAISKSFFNDNPNDEYNPLYFTGHCHLRNAQRTFRLNRIQNLEVLNITYKLAKVSVV